MTDALPMFGEYVAKIERISPVSIHGDMYFDAVLFMSAHSSVVTVRIAHHLCERAPVAGDEIAVSFLMSQVSGVRFATG
jgi:hypothetical protein